MIIDDDIDVCKEIKFLLQNETIDVYYTPSAPDGLKLITKYHFCLVIMETLLPKTNGFELLKAIQRVKPLPVLVLSSNTGSLERIKALRAGASGYVEKPYELEECLAYAQSLIDLYTRLHTIESHIYTLAFGVDLIIDPTSHQTTLKGELLNLTRKEFDLLFCLAEHVGQVLTREQLYSYVWKEDASYNVDELVKAHIKALRKKLIPAGKEYIKNVWGIGYRFSPDDDEQP